MEAEDGSIPTVVLQTPRERWDSQSHRAESSGHFVAVTVLELLCNWVRGEGRDIKNVGVIVGCDNEESLRMHDNEHWFASCQKDCDSLKLLQLRLNSMHIELVGQWVKGHQDDLCVVEILDWWGRTNVRCDQLAKVHLLSIINVQRRPLPHGGWF